MCLNDLLTGHVRLHCYPSLFYFLHIDTICSTLNYWNCIFIMNVASFPPLIFQCPVWVILCSLWSAAQRFSSSSLFLLFFKNFFQSTCLKVWSGVCSEMLSSSSKLCLLYERVTLDRSIFQKKHKCNVNEYFLTFRINKSFFFFFFTRIPESFFLFLCCCCLHDSVLTLENIVCQENLRRSASFWNTHTQQSESNNHGLKWLKSQRSHFSSFWCFVRT